MSTAEQAQVRTMFYADLREGVQMCQDMASKAADVQGIINDATAVIVDGGAEESKLASLVKPFRLARGQLQRGVKLCQEYEQELERRAAAADKAREEAMEPLGDEELAEAEAEVEESPDEPTE